MEKNVRATGPKRKLTGDALRTEVHAVCMAELIETVGPGPWEHRLATLRNYVKDPSPREKQARAIVAKLRNALIEAVVFAKVRRDDISMCEVPWPEGKDMGGSTAGYLELLGQRLAPFLRDRQIEIPVDLIDQLTREPSDATVLERAAEIAKRRPIKYRETNKRSLLARDVDLFNLIGLSPREDGTGSARFFTEREFALLSLLLGAGVLDEPATAQRFKKAGATAAEVIREEEKRMRIALKRHGWDARPEEIHAKARAEEEAKKLRVEAVKKAREKGSTEEEARKAGEAAARQVTPWRPVRRGRG